MSNKLFQGLIYQMREAVDREIGIIDDKGVVIGDGRGGRYRPFVPGLHQL